MHMISHRRTTAATVLRRDLIFAVVVILTTLGIARGSAAAEARSQPAGYAIDGVDTSRWQHQNGAAIDWSKVRAAGVEFATVKATRGVDRTDPYLKTDLEAARTAGLARRALPLLHGDGTQHGSCAGRLVYRCGEEHWLHRAPAGRSATGLRFRTRRRRPRQGQMSSPRFGG